jgi:DNA-binding FrmR family transcriptional regulator
MTKYKTRQVDTRRLIHRLHRIQGQLAALEEIVVTGNRCEDIVTRAYTIEKALSSFIMQVLNDYFDSHIDSLIQGEPESAKAEIQRLFQLVNRWTLPIRKDD